jgi:L-ascorbate metabolism protein UlaG (beta-lactamase superfamily)
LKITKYPQSCLKIEDAGHALLVDVGTLATADYAVADFGQFDAVLFTHSHADHFDVDKLDELAATGAQIYGNTNVAQLAGATKVEVVGENEELVVAGFKVKAVAMEHCLMVDGEPAGLPNTGFLINDRLLLPGDSTEDVEVTAEIVALPIFGPDISLKDAFGLAQATKAKILIPVHYDVASMNPAVFERLGGRGLDATITTLKNGESTEL